MIPRPNVMQKNLHEVEKLSHNNGGKLPNPWRMIQMGYGSLYRYIKRHPSVFKRFTFDTAVGTSKGRKTSFNVAIRKEHLCTAQKLTRIHQKLPDPAWLNANGYSRLAAYMRTYPEVFSNINSKKKKQKTKNKKQKNSF